MTLARLPHFPENIISIYDCLPQLLIPDQQKLAKIAKNTSVKHSPFSHVDLTGCFANCLWPQNFASEQFFYPDLCLRDLCESIITSKFSGLIITPLWSIVTSIFIRMMWPFSDSTELGRNQLVTKICFRQRVPNSTDRFLIKIKQIYSTLGHWVAILTLLIFPCPIFGDDPLLMVYIKVPFY